MTAEPAWLPTLLFTLAFLSFVAALIMWLRMKRGEGRPAKGELWRETRHLVIEDEPNEVACDDRGEATQTP